MTRPNILILMVDQLNGTLFPDGPADFLHAPVLKALAQRSVRFANGYTASPLCAPARASFMSGQLPSRTRVYDNAAEFASDIPTFAHHLRAAGYQTALSGKMHFVGPDQMHGFEERLTTDIYPADFGWTPDYVDPGLLPEDLLGPPEAPGAEPDLLEPLGSCRGLRRTEHDVVRRYGESGLRPAGQSGLGLDQGCVPLEERHSHASRSVTLIVSQRDW